MPTLKTLLQNWTFSQHGGGPANQDNEWLPAAKVPTSVHAELLRLGKIPDPFVGMNEWEVQWIGEGIWMFKTTFEVSQKELGDPHADLVFEGLDTYANVILNDNVVLQADNMFVTYRVPVKEHLKQGENELVLSFHSTFLKGKELESQHGKFALWNGDSSRLHVRKAQYNYGWDWGPVLLTVGPWRPVHLHTYISRIDSIRTTALLTPALTHAKLTTVVNTSPPVKSHVTLVLHSPTKEAITTTTVKVDAEGKAIVEWEFDIGEKEGDVELWWPVGYGKQPLYTIDAELTEISGVVLDTNSQKMGIRRVQIVQEPLEAQEGRSFLFEVNGVRIFCGGSNWIPADSFLTNITAERYRDWLQLLVDGNQNMIRVWAGGIYEDDVFYDLCDELGIMVWQDFLFGCGQYPAYDEFLKRVVPEAEQNVVRLRHHPSVVILAGNNEDYQVAEALKLDLDYSDEDPKSDFRNTTFPARHIYERVLPEIVERLSDIHYHRGSPYSGFGKDSRDRTVGDLHQWNVWHGSQEPWHNWDILSGRFVSEFGMEGFPNVRTVDYWLGGNKAERHPQSRTMNQHNKADGFERRLELYLVENFKHAFDLESYIYYTGIMQAECLSSAYRLWRRNWQGKGREYTAGALVWQINDCWPVTSWAIVDYFLRPKPAYFSIARELRTYSVGMTRKTVKTFSKNHPNTAAFLEIDTAVEIWGCNSRLQDKKVHLLLEAFDLDRKEWRWKEEKEVTLAANSSTELWKGSVPGQEIRTKESQAPRTIVLSARLIDHDGSVLARYANWPEPFKFIHYPPREALEFKVDVSGSSEPTKITLSSALPIKGIILEADGEKDVKWSDQALDLVPGDEQVVLAWGLDGREVKARFLGDGSA